MTRWILDQAVWVLSFLTSTVAIVTFSAGVFGTAEADTLAAVIALSLVAFLFLAWAGTQEIRYARKARYAEALEHIGDAFRSIARGVDSHSDSNDKAVILRSVCSDLAAAYGILTATRCAVVVKGLKGTNGRSHSNHDLSLRVETLVRDRFSSKSRGKADIGDVQHTLADNTHFKHILRKRRDSSEGRWFMCNDLPSLHQYESTSFKVYGEAHTARFPFTSGWVRTFRWPLPYRSTIVVEIVEPSGSDDARVLGFLAVDSKARNVFSQRYDVALLVRIADALGGLLRDGEPESKAGSQVEVKTNETRIDATNSGRAEHSQA